MEMLERYTSQGTPTGESISREEVHASGVHHSTVHIWLVNSNKEVLLQQRSFEKESHPGLWDISAAGHVPFGESHLVAAVRECSEELGISVSEDQLQPLFSVYQEFHLNEGKFIDREWVRVFLIKTDLPLQSFSVQPEEVAQVKWIPRNTFIESVVNRSSTLVPHWEEYEQIIQRIL